MTQPDPETPRLTTEPAAAPTTGDDGAAAPTPINRSLPPDPAAYDAPRAVLARQRGLSAPYIVGGRDPQPEEGLRQDRFYLRLLVAMVVTLVLAGFVFGIIANLITAARGG